jgi:hypothetical protein
VCAVGIVVVGSAIVSAVVDAARGIGGAIHGAANTPIVGAAVVVDAGGVVDAAVVAGPNPTVARNHSRRRDVRRGAIIHSVTGGEGKRAEEQNSEEMEG